MDLETKREFVAKLSKQYNKADKKGKGAILDRLVLVAGYHRKYAIEVLLNPPVQNHRIFILNPYIFSNRSYCSRTEKAYFCKS